MYALVIAAHALTLWTAGELLRRALGWSPAVPCPRMILGAGLISSTLVAVSTLFGHVGQGPARFVGFLIAMLGVPLWLHWLRGALRGVQSSGQLAGICLVPVAMALLWSVANPVAGFDGIAFWSARGRALHETGSVAETLAWASLPHRDYPLFSSCVEWWAYILAGGYGDERVVKGYQPLLVGSAGLCLFAFLRRRHGTPVAGACAFAWLSSRAVHGFTAENWADLPLACGNLVAALCCARAATEDDDADVLPAAAVVTLLPEIKLEGALLAIVQLLACALVLQRQRRGPSAKAIAATLLFAAIWCGPSLVARAAAAPSSEYVTSAGPGFAKSGDSLESHARRVLVYTSATMLGLGDQADRSDAGPLWVLTLLAAFTVGRRGTDRGAALVATIMAAQVGVYMAVLVYTPYLPEAQLPVAIGRLLWHVAPLGLVVVASAIAPHEDAPVVEAAEAGPRQV